MMSSGLLDPPSGPSHSIVVESPLGQDLNVTYHRVPAANDSPVSFGNGNISGGGGGGGMSAEEVEIVLKTRFVMYGVLGNILVVLGLLGNTLSIVVLCNRRMRSSTSYYLTSLAVYDNFILLSMLLFFNLPALGTRVPDISRWHDGSVEVMMPMWYPLSLAAQMGSIYTCVAFTVERFIAVCRPLHAANTCTKSRAKRTILLIFLWSILYNIPRYFHYEASTVWNNHTQTHETHVLETEFAKNDVFRHVYIIYFQLIFMFLLPFLVIAILNAALLKAINRSRQQRQQMSTSATREHNLTVMLVAVIVVFLVCQFPTIVDNVLVAIVKEEKHGEVLEYQLIYTISTFLVTINSSLNFVLYCLFGKKFRMVLCHVLGLASSAHKDSQYRSTLYHSRTNGTHGTHNHTYDVEVSIV